MRIGPRLLAVMVLVASSEGAGFAQPADTRAGAERTPSSAAAGSGADARTAPGQRMFKRVLREAFPHPRKSTIRPTEPGDRAAAASGPPARSAIGLALPAAPAIDAARKSSTSAGPPFKATAGAPISGSGLVMPRSGLVAAPSAAPGGLARTGINGTAMVRKNSGPATVGGGARSVTGINGTNFRPKHGN
jgi:hypothetical protein